MIGKTIVVAADESLEGRHAIQTARHLAESRGARWMVLTVSSPPAKSAVAAGGLISFDPRVEPGGRLRELMRFVDWLGPDAGSVQTEPPEVALAFGVPGIEISRFAALRAADLIILGRRARAPDRRLLLGETSDAVVRRSTVPVLFVPQRIERLRTMVVALDGTDRAGAVLETARQTASALGAVWRALMVEPRLADETDVRDGRTVPRGRTARWALSLGNALEVRRGNPAEEILGYVEETKADLLVIGYRRGGPSQVIGPTDTARTLLHAASAAILTVPI